MAKSSLPTTPQLPPMWGFLSWRVVRWITFLGAFAVFVGTFVVLVGWLQGYRVSDANLEPTPEPGPLTIPDEPPPNPYPRRDDRQAIRGDLEGIDYEAGLVLNDIDEFEKEALAWRESYEELLVSDTGKKLKSDDWVIRYFLENRDNEPREFLAADHFRRQVDTRMAAVRQALADPNGEFERKEKSIRGFESIAERVAKAREAYKLHRELLDALAGKADSDDEYVPRNLKEAVDRLGWEQILADFGHPDYVGWGSADPTDGTPDGPTKPIVPNPEPLDKLDKLHEEHLKQQQDAGEIGRSTPIRDY